VLPLVVAFFEGADGDVAVRPKPLILNPAGTEGQALINTLMAMQLSIGWPETGFEEVNGDLREADFGGVREISFIRLQTCGPA